MNTKLTLKLEENVIFNAKKYALNHEQSLSSLVESFFMSLTEKKTVEHKNIPPTVKSLIGVLKSKKELKIKDDYTDYLIGKYK